MNRSPTKDYEAMQIEKLVKEYERMQKKAVNSKVFVRWRLGEWV